MAICAEIICLAAISNLKVNVMQQEEEQKQKPYRNLAIINFQGALDI